MLDVNLQIGTRQLTLVLQIRFPLDTLSRIAQFIDDKNIKLDGILIMNESKPLTTLVLHLMMEKDTCAENLRRLSVLPGVMRLDEGEPTVRRNVIHILLPYLNKN